MAFRGDGDTFAAFSGLVPVCYYCNPELRKVLAEAHYHPRDRMLTPLQVRAVVEFLGEP